MLSHRKHLQGTWPSRNGWNRFGCNISCQNFSRRGSKQGGSTLALKLRGDGTRSPKQGYQRSGRSKGTPLQTKMQFFGKIRQICMFCAPPGGCAPPPPCGESWIRACSGPTKGLISYKYIFFKKIYRPPSAAIFFLTYFTGSTTGILCNYVNRKLGTKRPLDVDQCLNHTAILSENLYKYRRYVRILKLVWRSRFAGDRQTCT